MNEHYEALVNKAVELGEVEAKIMDADEIVFDPRSFLKCRFGCRRWGRYWTCPPHVGLSRETFMEAFGRYGKAIMIKSADPKIGQEVTMAVEKEAMMDHGMGFAFALVLCVQCDECAHPEPCRYPHLARPSMDAYGIDIGKTLEHTDFKVEFDKEGKLLPAWYSLVLLD